MTINGGSTTHLGTASQFDSVDYQLGTGNGQIGELTIADHQFIRTVGTSSSPACNQNPAVYRNGSGRLTMIGDRMSDMGTAGTGSCPNQFIKIPADDYNRVIGNVGPGWANVFLSSIANGVYQFNGGTSAALPTTAN